ncbi:MAG: type IV secretion system DNA-binding domain-containing protein [Nitrospirae bacterium]|nr:type IV secretion system DNA-binding domain-containing protein [Nitrospirota bacterium]
MAEQLPYIFSRQREGKWYTFFAIKLNSILTFDPEHGEHKNFAFELLNRQIDFINTLDCPEDERVINLRFICRPDPSFYRRGKIDVVLIIRIPSEDKDISIIKAKKVFNDIWPIITSISENYEFEPVFNQDEFHSFYKPFPINSVAEIARRDDIIEINTAKRIRVKGFSSEGNTELSGVIDNDKIYYTYPFIWGANSVSRIFKTMQYQKFPSMVSIILKPVAFNDDIEKLFLEKLEKIEATVALHRNTSRIQSIAKNLNSQLLRIEDSPFYLKILVASEGEVAKGLIDSVGVEITEHAGSPDIVKDTNDDYVFSGGYEWYYLEKEKAENEIEWLDINFSVPSVAPGDDKKMRYIFDSTQANCAFRFPVPDMNETPGITTKFYKSVMPPSNIPETGVLLGHSTREGISQMIRIDRDDRRRHMYIAGQTGTGKSTLLLNMIQQDIENNEGLAVLDPHGELIDEIMLRIPERRINDVVYINFEDTESPVAINMLECKTELEKDMAVNHMMEIFGRLYDLEQAGGPMFEMYMKNALYLILEDSDSGATLLDVQKVFGDRNYRNYKLSKAGNSVVVEFWKKIAEEAGGESRLENMVPYVISKLSMFIYNNTVRNIIASQKSSINFREIMDSGEILLVDLCKGKLGKTNSDFLGMVIVSKILTAALGRSEIEDKKSLKDFYLYVDEFQNLATDSFVSLLSEARKYRLNAILANQYLTQVNEDVLHAIFGNVGSMITFRLGINDAALMEREFYPVFTGNEIIKLPNWTVCSKILSKGEILRPFVMNTLSGSEGKDPNVVRKIKEHSRAIYGRDARDIEKEILVRYKKIYN